MQGEMAFDEADLHGLVDGRIEPSRAAALAASLGSDPEAAARVEAWRRQTESLKSMFTSVLCEPVPVRLLPTVVPARDAPSGRAAPSATPARRIAGAVATTAIGSALVGFALGALSSLGTDGFGLAPQAAREIGGVGGAGVKARDVAARAVEAHRTFLAGPPRPVDVVGSTAGSTAGGAAAWAGLGEAPKLVRAVGRRVGAGLKIPDLARQGWTLVDGRVVPGRSGPAAFLTYGDGSDSLGLLVSRDGGEQAGGSARVVAADDGAGPLGVATWTDGDFAYALTSDRGREWLARHLAPLRDAVRADAAKTQARAAEEPARAP